MEKKWIIGLVGIITAGILLYNFRVLIFGFDWETANMEDFVNRKMTPYVYDRTWLEINNPHIIEHYMTELNSVDIIIASSFNLSQTLEGELGEIIIKYDNVSLAEKTLNNIIASFEEYPNIYLIEADGSQIYKVNTTIEGKPDDKDRYLWQRGKFIFLTMGVVDKTPYLTKSIIEKYSGKAIGFNDIKQVQEGIGLTTAREFF